MTLFPPLSTHHGNVLGISYRLSFSSVKTEPQVTPRLLHRYAPALEGAGVFCLCPHEGLYFEQVLCGYRYLAKVAENHVKEDIVGDVESNGSFAVLYAE